MALRTIREIGDPILEKECKPLKAVSDRTIDLINDCLLYTSPSPRDS